MESSLVVLLLLLLFISFACTPAGPIVDVVTADNNVEPEASTGADDDDDWTDPDAVGPSVSVVVCLFVSLDKDDPT